MSVFDGIGEKYGWKITAPPVRLDGGFLHRMYRLETDQGVYALKLLNPYIMWRKTAMENYARAERLERVLQERHIPILPALTLGGKKMQEVGGRFFYVFDFYEGKPLRGKEITPFHCAKIGRTLAEIHGVERTSGEADHKEMSVDWDFYLSEMKKADAQLYDLLEASRAVILESQERGNRAKRSLPNVLAVCHNDMDCKNVLWKGDDFRVIDLECLGYANPFMELFELALCWSGYEECKLDFRRYRAFVRGYAEAGGELPADWENLYDCNNGRLEWLEYNLRRALGMDCGADEKKMGIGQVEETLRLLRYYSEMKGEILAHCPGPTGKAIGVAGA